MRKTQFRSDLAEVFENVQKTLPLERVPVMSPGGITRNHLYATGSNRKQPQKPAADPVRAKACFSLCGLGAEW